MNSSKPTGVKDRLPLGLREQQLTTPSLEIWRDGDYVLCVTSNRLLDAVYFTGYVGVPEGHPMHGDSPSYKFVNIEAMKIHGGITYCDKFKDIEVCYWFYGFDMAHGSDLDLSRLRTSYTLTARPHVTYEYAMQETARLLNYVKCWIQWF